MDIRNVSVWAAILAACGSPCPGRGQPISPGEQHAPILASLPDGRRIAMHCEGVGSPTVIFDSGLGMGGSAWRRVQPELSKRTRTCSYDRAGYGSSDPGPFPRDARHIASDLDAALKAANITGPYVLVGHSMGGYNMRMYANLHRRNVMGMVLVDPSIDGNDKPMIAAVASWARRATADEAPGLRCIRATATGQMKLGNPIYAECGSPPAGSALARPEMAQAVLSERGSLDASSAEVQATQIRYGAMPLIVLTAGAKFDSGEGWSAAEVETLRDAWREGHRRIARLSDIGIERLVDGAPHVIQIAKPEAVIEAVDDVIKAGR